jgi:hypothetical protein
MTMLLPLALGIALIAVAGFGIGYELADPGLGASLFLLMAVGGAFLSAMLALDGAPGAGMPLTFGSLPALVAAGCAYAGGARRERR